MITYMLVGIMVFGCLWIILNLVCIHNRPTDSALKQRAVFTHNQQLTYKRLQEIVPESYILAHVSFDSLLTTKYARTRHKYRNMIADFVILDQTYHIVAIVALTELNTVKRMTAHYYEDDLLRMVGYKVLRYQGVPEIKCLRNDFMTAHLFENLQMPDAEKTSYTTAELPCNSLS